MEKSTHSFHKGKLNGIAVTDFRISKTKILIQRLQLDFRLHEILGIKESGKINSLQHLRDKK